MSPTPDGRSPNLGNVVYRTPRTNNMIEIFNLIFDGIMQNYYILDFNLKEWCKTIISYVLTVLW